MLSLLAIIPCKIIFNVCIREYLTTLLSHLYDYTLYARAPPVDDEPAVDCGVEARVENVVAPADTTRSVTKQ